MPTLNALLLVAGSGFLFSLSPGPSMLYVVSRAISQGRSAGYASAVGLALGGAALAVITALASGWLLTDRPTLFQAIKILGGLYLLYLGTRMLFAARSTRLGEVTDVEDLPFTKILRQGFTVELLNPKTILFFLAFLPGFVDPERSSVTTQMLILGVLVPLTAIPSDLTVSAGGAWLADRMRERMSIGHIIEGVGAVVVLALGVRTLMSV